MVRTLTGFEMSSNRLIEPDIMNCHNETYVRNGTSGALLSKAPLVYRRGID